MMRWIPAALAVAALLVGPGCYVEPVVPGASVTVAATAPALDAGYYRVWYDGAWVYYVDGSWTYYNPAYHGWVSYRRVPPGLSRYEYSARAVHPGHMSKVVPGYAPSKATPRYSVEKATPRYSAGKATPRYTAEKARPLGPGKSRPRGHKL
jgi:hypothetical protein